MYPTEVIGNLIIYYEGGLIYIRSKVAGKDWRTPGLQEYADAEAKLDEHPPFMTERELALLFVSGRLRRTKTPETFAVLVRGQPTGHFVSILPEALSQKEEDHA